MHTLISKLEGHCRWCKAYRLCANLCLAGSSTAVPQASVVFYNATHHAQLMSFRWCCDSPGVMVPMQSCTCRVTPTTTRHAASTSPAAGPGYALCTTQLGRTWYLTTHRWTTNRPKMWNPMDVAPSAWGRTGLQAASQSAHSDSAVATAAVPAYGAYDGIAACQGPLASSLLGGCTCAATTMASIDGAVATLACRQVPTAPDQQTSVL